MNHPLWHGRPNAPNSLWHYGGVLKWIAIPLYLLGIMVFFIARANWAEVEGAGMVWLLSFFIAGPLAVGIAMFPGAAIIARKNRRAMTYSVTREGAQINRANYPITGDTPIRRSLKGDRSIVTFRDPVRRRVYTSGQVNSRRWVTIAAKGFYHLNEDDARAAEAALLSLRDQAG